MEITQEVQDILAQYQGCRTEVTEYGRFGSILRLWITDAAEDRWLLSFSDCRMAVFRSGTFPMHFSASPATDGTLCVSDTNGDFQVAFKQCFLIHEDDYLADDPPPRSHDPKV